MIPNADIIRFVNGMFAEMATQQVADMTVSESSLRSAAEDPAQWQFGERFPQILNRLKTMAGLDTAPSDQSIAGRIMLRIEGRDYIAAVDFTNDQPEPICNIRLSASDDPDSPNSD